jgi:predicted Holliday junction resolvase-like endonuclease
VTTLIWIVIALIVVALVVGIALAVRRGRQRKLTVRATELRTEAAQRDEHVVEERRRAAEAEAKAQLARAEAERAEEKAHAAQQAASYEEARQEDSFREADRLDPHVDERSPSYGTDTPAAGGSQTSAQTTPQVTPEQGHHRRDV